MCLFSAIKGRLYFIEITRRIPFAVSAAYVFWAKETILPVIRLLSFRAFFFSSIAILCMSVLSLSARGVIHGVGNINNQHRSSCLADSRCCFVHLDFQLNLIGILASLFRSLV